LRLQVKSILKYLFPVPKPESKRVMTFANTNDFISFRYEPEGGYRAALACG